MSMEYNVYTALPRLPDRITASLLSELNKFDMTCEIHPDCSIQTANGFTPFKLRLHNSQFPELDGKEFISGVEISIEEFEMEDQ